MKYVLCINNFYLPYVFNNKNNAIIEIYNINKKIQDKIKKEYFKDKQPISLKRYKKLKKYGTYKIKIKEI